MTGEIIHQRTRYARNVTCGITGPVRVEEALYKVTCPRCRYEGSPVDETRARQFEAAHAEALDANHMQELRRTHPQRDAIRRQAWQNIPRYWSADLGRYVTIPEN